MQPRPQGFSLKWVGRKGKGKSPGDEVEDNGQNPRRLVLKPFTGNCKRTNLGYSHCFFLIGVQTKFFQQIKSIVHAIPFRENHTKLYSLLVFSTGRWKPYTVRSLTLSNGTPMYSPCGGDPPERDACFIQNCLRSVVLDPKAQFPFLGL